MKNISKILMLMAAVAAASSCQKTDLENQDKPAADGKDRIVVRVSEESSAAKTHLDDELYVIWDENEVMKLFCMSSETGEPVSADSESASLSTDGKTAEFAFTLSGTDGWSNFIYGGIYPSTAVSADVTDASACKVLLPSEQSPTVSAYDPSAFIMVAKPQTFTSAQTAIDQWFRRAVALNKVTFSGLGLASDEKVCSVKISASIPLTGTKIVALATGETGDFAAESAACEYVSLTYATPFVISGNSFDAWFTSWNAQLAAGDSFEAEIVTDNAVYRRTVTLADEKTISFVEGAYNTLTVDMSSVTGETLGSGTESDPYIIKNRTQFINMTNLLASGTVTYINLGADIDMSGYTGWVSLNAVSPYDKAVNFDGCGHKITGFTYTPSSTACGMFHTLIGSFSDTVFESSAVDGLNVPGGLLAYQIGTKDNASAVSGVTLNNVTLNVKGTPAGVGALAGCVVNSVIEEVTVSNVTIADADGDGKGAYNTGGVVGAARYVKSSFVNVTSSGTVFGAERVGGIVGNVVNENEGKVAGTSFENCSSSVQVTGVKYVGGLAGLLEAPDITVKSCHATGNITNTGTDTGGLVGWAGLRISMTGSYATGNVTSKDHYMGGLVGSLSGQAEIRRCYATGNITSNSTATKANVGGLIGIAARNDGGSTIEDCYAAGNVTGGNCCRFIGGLVGTVENKSGVVINRCFASGNVTNKHSALGGLVGICKSTNLNDATLVNTVTNCIVWGERVRNDNAVDSNMWSSGAFIGASNSTNTLKNNWRRADMDFRDLYDETLFDCEDADASNPLTYSGTHQSNFHPYHGKAAPENATISSVAKSIGWPEDVWDLSGDTPKLK